MITLQDLVEVSMDMMTYYDKPCSEWALLQKMNQSLSNFSLGQLPPTSQLSLIIWQLPNEEGEA